MAKPISTEATFVQSTAGRALTRRSTSGERVRSSKRPQTPNTTADAPSSASAARAPHSAPFEIASSRQTSATASPTAPGRSKRPPARTGDSSTQRSTAATRSAPSTAAPAEQPPPAGVLGDDAGERQADGAADAQRRAHQRDAAADPALGQHVAHDADAQRDHAERRALQRPRDDQRAARRGRARRAPNRPSPAPARRRASGACRTCRPGGPASARRRRPATRVAVTSHVTVDVDACEQLRVAGQEGDDKGLHQRDGQAARRQDPDDERGAGVHRFR